MTPLFPKLYFWAFATTCSGLFLGMVPIQSADKVDQMPLDILVVAPHPDDEALGCAGVMLQAGEKKKRIGVVLVTNGDGFPQAAAIVANKAARQLGPEDFLKLAAIRQQHSLGALAKIGVRAHDLLFLGYPDAGLKTMYEFNGDTPCKQKYTQKAATYGAVVRDYHSLQHGRPAPYLKNALLDDLAEIIKKRRPREIYVTNASDSHPDHQASFWFVRDAARSAGFRGTLFTYVVHGKPPPGPALRVALTAAQQGRKRAIIEEYQTKLSPIHDNLAEQFTKAEEVFWPIRID